METKQDETPDLPFGSNAYQRDDGEWRIGFDGEDVAVVLPHRNAAVNATLLGASAQMMVALEAVVTLFTNVNVLEPEDVIRQVIEALREAGYAKYAIEDMESSLYGAASLLQRPAALSPESEA